ncbi:hypothetical protein MMC09_004910 [Bachmanniomyces sp. S44760]|nr:hypothetical protein [Bachmanniomyces sp. S44760]
MHRLLAQKKLVTSLRRKRSEASLTTSATPSDLLAEKSAPYKHPSYEAMLGREAGSYAKDYEPGVTEASEKFCQHLLDSKQTIPQDTLFRDDIFVKTCEILHGKNEARVFKDVTPLIVPWAEAHALFSADRGLDIAIESVNEGWNNSRPITVPRPQPDYAVGFRESAFSADQLTKLQPYVGDFSCSSYFMGTWYMYFPFLTCEVKCSTSSLDIADRQNLHSMTLAIRAVVELYQLVNRVEELHREVLAFSISHDQANVRIYGHFPVIEGTKVTYWRRPLQKYDFTVRKGLDKWTAFTFVKNVYDIWMPIHFKRLCSAIDALPVEQGTETSLASVPYVLETTEPSQPFEQEILTEATSGQPSLLNQQPITSDPSARTEGPAIRRKKNKRPV